MAKDPLLRTALASGGLALTAADLNTGAAVGWRDGEDPDAVALRIRDQVAGVNVQLPSELSRMLRSSTAFFSALIVGIGVLGLVIGGLSLANTVSAAVFERIRDFGVKRALGATDLQLAARSSEALAVTLTGAPWGRSLALGGSVQMYGAERPASVPLLAATAGGALVSRCSWARWRLRTRRSASRVSPAEAIRRGA